MRKLLFLLLFILSFTIIHQTNAQKINEINQIKWEELEWEQLADKLYRKYVYGSQGMIAMFKMDKGAKVPIHKHPNEQLTYIVKGSVKVTMENQDYIVKAGEVLIIPPNVPHKFICLEDGTIDIDFFTPLRMDWLMGTDSYFKED
ncbi:cupin domain-containing protein [Tunicatimonas pelagia]|uniref:cupin domain-containing protein n=1 Tax=Tunicatimonas pelagia TaxID=931531 RepID=UPI0026664409|nr:cupin domain-containing protein [Tunicatimonas pelagia]WKN42767.1 cupin domain-containing protein [Tunicatimonas pelagia]